MSRVLEVEVDQNAEAHSDRAIAVEHHEVPLGKYPSQQVERLGVVELIAIDVVEHRPLDVLELGRQFGPNPLIAQLAGLGRGHGNSTL